MVHRIADSGKTVIGLRDVVNFINMNLVVFILNFTICTSPI